MNITTDNYEAYLLDYMEGKLSPEGATELKAFITAQGLDWDELTEPLPHLEVPNIVYKSKNSLGRPFDRLRDLRPLSLSKRRPEPTIIPLYVKIASAAAAAGLLLTVTLRPEKSLPEAEPIAELKPIEITKIDHRTEFEILPKRAIRFVQPQASVKEKEVVQERVETPLLAELQPIKATKTQIVQPTPDPDDPDFDLLAYRINANLAFAPTKEYSFAEYETDEHSLSLIGKGLLWITGGRHASFGSLVNAGLDQAKQKVTETATDMALTAYHRVEDGFEETRERWEEKQGK